MLSQPSKTCCRVRPQSNSLPMSTSQRRQSLKPLYLRPRSRNRVGNISPLGTITAIRPKKNRRSWQLLVPLRRRRTWKISVNYWEKEKWKSSTKSPTRSSELRGTTQLSRKSKGKMTMGSRKSLKTACKLTKSSQAISKGYTRDQITCSSIWQPVLSKMMRWQTSRSTQLLPSV